MKNYINTLKRVELLDQIEENEIDVLLSCLDSRVKTYTKSDFIFSQGSKIDSVGIILSGRVDIVKEDYSGKRVILSNLSESEIFGEVFACAGIKISPVSVVASCDCEILFIDYNRIISSCSSACEHHTLLISNMLRLIAKKNLNLNKKIDFLILKGLREKIAAFLIDKCLNENTTNLFLPFDRNELADFLNVDRSALSRELSRMKSEGFINYKKNNFQILKLQDLKSLSE